MDYLLAMIKEMVSSKCYMLLYGAILVLSIFQGKIASWHAVKGINEILTSKYSIVDEFKDEIIKKHKLKDIFTEYYNYVGKAQTYFVLGIASLGQLIGLLVAQNVDRISINVCMLTITICFIEFRDNRGTSKKLNNEIKSETSKIIESYLELDTMANDDFALDILVREKHITEEKRAEFIKEEARKKLL